MIIAAGTADWMEGRALTTQLVMRVDFVIPRAKKGKKTPENLVACCIPCNTIKGTKMFLSFDHARAYVIEHRDALRKTWEAKTARPMARAAKA
jgi:5-methylcytosine-specific restriction endonuclease McrA